MYDESMMLTTIRGCQSHFFQVFCTIAYHDFKCRNCAEQSKSLGLVDKPADKRRGTT